MDQSIESPHTNDADLLSFALELAKAARAETLGGQLHLNISDKGSHGIFDPVTNADRAAERAMRQMIGRTFPDHAICGEEYGQKKGRSGFTWSLDPIDGTRSYICGLPSWTTLIGLLKEEEPVLGVIDAPVLDELYVAMEGEATIIRNGERASISTSGCSRINEARFSTTDPFLFGPAEGRLHKLLSAVRVSRFGHDAYSYGRLAAGTIDLVVETGLKPHDYWALIPIVRAAGGHFGDWHGGCDFTNGDVVAAASSELYHEAVALLAEE